MLVINTSFLGLDKDACRVAVPNKTKGLRH